MNSLTTSDKPKGRSRLEKGRRILFATPNPNLQGPIPKLAPVLIAKMEELGWQVTTSNWGRRSDTEGLIQKISGRFADIHNIMRRLVKIEPDILYVDTTLDEHSLIRDFALLVVAKWFPAKIVLKIHGSKTALLIEPRHRIYKSLARSIIRRSNAILLLSDDGMQKWRCFEPKGRYYRVDNPIAPMRQSTSESDPSLGRTGSLSPTLLFVGRLIEEKGIFELIEAMTLISSQVCCHLLIAGDGKEKAEIIRRIHIAGLGDSISLLGYLNSEKLSSVYQKSTMLILPSYREGFPTTITEAMHFGLPIVTTPVGGIPDHLRDGVNALFVKPKDPESIASAVLQLLNDPKLRAEMRCANLEKIRELKPESAAAKYDEILSELAGG